MADAEEDVGAEFLGSLDDRIERAAASDDPATVAHGRRLEFMRPFLRTKYAMNPQRFGEQVDSAMRALGIDPDEGREDFRSLE